MGLLDRLFGTVRTNQPTKPKTGTPARPGTAKPGTPARPAGTKPAPTAAKPPVKPAGTVPSAAKSPAAPAPAAAKPLPSVIPKEQPAAVPAEEPTVIEPETPALPTQFPEELQKRLDSYFARLRQEYPEGEIRRLNTGHKKLAERGAELRRLIGYEGKLDEFFALGGFTYHRSAGGRPTLPAAATESVEDRLRAMFPEDVPTVLAVKQADPRLYLDLRAAARKQGRTAGEFLQQFKEEA